ncbi:MAG: AMP-binding protein [Burkholderiaceae bacterium]
MNIAQSLLERARISPHAPAISDERGATTFAALAQRACGMAGGLRGRLAMMAGDRVMVLMENRREFIEAMFASWIAGLCVVPVNAKLHPREVAHIAGDCGAKALFTSESLFEGWAGYTPETQTAPLCIVAGSAAYEALAEGEGAACERVGAHDAAWIFYTSGTTGTPKGATLTHCNLLAQTRAYYADIEAVAGGHTMLHAAPLSHGSGMYCLPHLMAGGHQVIAPSPDAQQMLEVFDRYPEVSMFMAPTMLNRLVRAAQGVPDAAHGLRTIIYGGAPMYLSDLQRALEALGPRLYQLYGQGEAPMTITGLPKAHHLGPGDAMHLARLASCGLPRTGVEVRILGEAGELLATGEPGEIVTRSECVMRGYWNNAAATGQALNGGWLRTGDIGSLDELGYLTLRDRSKDMIISGGHNIYPREIEEILLRHAGVVECSVVGRAHSEWGEVPVAFVVGQAGSAPTMEELDALCLDHMARFKRPREYRFVDALPKNNYGKVLKTQLRARLAQTAPTA